jgi:uncharacterized metal-binding protein YceD (DUF177 family)
MITPELHRPVATDRIATMGQSIELRADAAECAAIALRLGVPAVHALTCRFHVTRQMDARSGEIIAEGHLKARLDRDCVVTLERFTLAVEERFRVRFVPEGTEAGDDDPESDDEIPYAGTGIDLGEAAVEQLALTLDPYPRKPGAELPPEASDPEESAFAALAALARRGQPS